MKTVVYFSADSMVWWIDFHCPRTASLNDSILHQRYLVTSTSDSEDRRQVGEYHH